MIAWICVVIVLAHIGVLTVLERVDKRNAHRYKEDLLAQRALWLITTATIVLLLIVTGTATEYVVLVLVLAPVFYGRYYSANSRPPKTSLANRVWRSTSAAE